MTICHYTHRYVAVNSPVQILCTFIYVGEFYRYGMTQSNSVHAWPNCHPRGYTILFCQQAWDCLLSHTSVTAGCDYIKMSVGFMSYNGISVGFYLFYLFITASEVDLCSLIFWFAFLSFSHWFVNFYLSVKDITHLPWSNFFPVYLVPSSSLPFIKV